jgi:GNAT superfamily N-acetyltransferase
MTDKLEIRQMDVGDLARAIDWAAGEGWNPGLDDANAFYAADGDGFFMGWIGNQPVSSISLVKYSAGFAFLGLYIVAEEYRGNGIGLATWNAGLASVPGRSIGLDGVVAQQDNYRKSGFVLAHNNIRYGGNIEIGERDDTAIKPATAEILPAICTYDERCFGAERPDFIRFWTTGPATHKALAYFDDGNLRGYGVIRACRQGHKVGPLFADTPSIAKRLLESLVANAAAREIFLDVPEPNAEAVKLAKSFGLSPVFETARMYRGTGPALPLDKIFGITTFELG